MSEELGGLEDILLKSNSETTSASPAELAARASAAAAAMAKLKKSEKASKKSDDGLVAVLKTLDYETIKVVAGLISSGVPSLTILALLSLTSSAAKQALDQKFTAFVQEWAFVEPNTSQNPKNQAPDQLSQWWTYLIMADHLAEDQSLQNLGAIKETFDKAIVFFIKNNFKSDIPPAVTAYYDKYHGFLFPKS